MWAGADILPQNPNKPRWLIPIIICGRLVVVFSVAIPSNLPGALPCIKSVSKEAVAMAHKTGR
jgi:hypothetical protein